MSVGFEWESPFRYRRITEVLSGEGPHTVAGSVALQNDYLSLVARELSGPVGRLRCTDPQAARGAELLSGWDNRLDADSAGGALFEVWFRGHLRPALIAGVLAGLADGGDRDAAQELLVSHAGRFGDARIVLGLIGRAGAAPPLTAARIDEILESTLASAVSQLDELLGSDCHSWRWGAVHQASLRHPLAGGSGLGADELERLGRQPRGGCADTVGNTGYGDTGFDQAVGATMRMVLDVGEWDNSLAMNSPGQSGVATSPHYADLLAAWARDESFPLLYSRERIEAATERRFLLVPDAAPN